MRTRTIVAGLLAFALAGCFTPTWRPVRQGEALRPDTVILVGSFVSDPPIRQHDLPRNCPPRWVNGRFEPAGKIIFVQETDGNVMAFFSPDLSERWSPDAMQPISSYDWTYMPLQGHFFVEVPRADRIYLRGFTYLTNAGGVRFELPAQLDVGPRDRVVYVGEIRLHRGAKRWVEFRDQPDGARRAARERGLDEVARAPWKTRLLKTTGKGSSLGDEVLDGCQGHQKL